MYKNNLFTRSLKKKYITNFIVDALSSVVKKQKQNGSYMTHAKINY